MTGFCPRDDMDPQFSGESYWHLTLTCKAHQPLVLRGGHSLDVEIERQRLESKRFLCPWKHLSNEFSEDNNMLFERIRNLLTGTIPEEHIKVSGNLRWDDSGKLHRFTRSYLSWLTNRRSQLRKVKCNPQLLWCQKMFYRFYRFTFSFCGANVWISWQWRGENSISAKHTKNFGLPEVPMGRKSSS